MRAFLVLSPLLLACVGDTDTPKDAGPDAIADSTIADSQPDVPSDVQTNDVAEAGTVYGDFTSAANFTTVDITTLAGKPYIGGVFDGKYVYYVPGNGNTVLLRYNTTLPFSVASFEKLDLTPVSSSLGFAGGVFDGTYVYLVPFQHVATANSVLVRYDTTKAFNNTASYQAYDLTGTSDGSAAAQFQGGAFDGKFIYFTPYNSGEPLRFDSAAIFNQSAGYEGCVLAGNFSAWSASIFDGKYLYMAPLEFTGSASGRVERYDSTQTFAGGASPGLCQNAAWTGFDLGTNIDKNAVQFDGAIFDGKHVYFVPGQKTLAVSYDTTAQFAQSSSWLKFDVSAVNAGAGNFAGGTFDGRYVYFVPNGTFATPSGLAIRYDTTQSFTSTNAWQFFDMTTNYPTAKGFQGGVFDGRYVYYIPSSNSLAVRFDAKTPPSLPSVRASFF